MDAAPDPAAAGAPPIRPAKAARLAHGAQGALIMLGCFITPWQRNARQRWGLSAGDAGIHFPGDELVPDPRWGWAHGIEIDAPADEVWPWVAQVGADRAGFYSYEALENLAGCGVRNAEEIHPEWMVRAGDGLSLHPKMPALPIVAVEPGRWFAAHAPTPHGGAPSAKGEMAVSWLFLVEPLGPERSRFISRYRCATSDDLATRIQFGPLIVEPIGFAMDRAMLLGVKARAER